MKIKRLNEELNFNNEDWEEEDEEKIKGDFWLVKKDDMIFLTKRVKEISTKHIPFHRYVVLEEDKIDKKFEFTGRYTIDESSAYPISVDDEKNILDNKKTVCYVSTLNTVRCDYLNKLCDKLNLDIDSVKIKKW
jgi:hypothetical protein